MDRFNCKETGRPLIVVSYEYWKHMEDRVKSAEATIKKAVLVLDEFWYSGRPSEEDHISLTTISHELQTWLVDGFIGNEEECLND